MKSLHLAAAMLALGLAACTNEDENPIPEGPVAAQVSASIQGALTKAYDQTWEANDQIGISTTDANVATKYINMCYTTTGDGTFTHEGGEATGIFFESTEEVIFSAYYPFFKNTEGTLPGTDGMVSDLSTQDQSNQKNFDFLFAEGITASKKEPSLAFSFEHKMTRLVLNIKPNTEAGLTADDVKNGIYSLNGITHEGAFDVTNGTAQATGEAIENWDITATPLQTDNGLTYSLIFFPQTLSSDLTFKATIQGQDYSCTFKPELAASTSYTYNISVMKEKLSVGNCTIKGWSEGTGDNLNAEM